MTTASFTHDQLVDALCQMGCDGEDDAQVRADYSGRGMYGATCFGVVCGSHQIGLVALAITAAIADIVESNGEDTDYAELIDTAAGIVGTMRVDSMGRDQIAYFPGWTLAVED